MISSLSCEVILCRYFVRLCSIDWSCGYPNKSICYSLIVNAVDGWVGWVVGICVYSVLYAEAY